MMMEEVKLELNENHHGHFFIEDQGEDCRHANRYFRKCANGLSYGSFA